MAYNIVFATNEGYLPYLGVSIQSIISNSNKEDEFCVHILYDKISDNLQKQILKMQTDNVKISFINVNNYLKINPKLLKTVYHLTKEAYYRFLIPSLFPECEKVLYVDCDLVFNVNPKIYFDINLENYYLAAVNDIGLVNMTRKAYGYVKSFGVEPEKYFNSGVLVMNIKELLKINLLEKLGEMLKEKKNYLFPDQDILNIICKDKVYYLDYAYNFQWKLYLDNLPEAYFANKELYQKYYKAAEHPYIVHYISAVKPWNNIESPFAFDFWKYARLTSFYETILLNSYANKVCEIITTSKFKYYKYKLEAILRPSKKDYYQQKYQKLEKNLKLLKRI